MNIIHNGKLHLFKNDINQCKTIFYDRCWFIAKSNTLTNNEEEEIKNMKSLLNDFENKNLKLQKEIKTSNLNTNFSRVSLSTP